MAIIKPGDTEYRDAQWVRKPHGSIQLDGQEVAVTLQCPHCGGHFVSRTGSGVKRSYCLKCAAVTCGGPQCRECNPWEKQMEAIERNWLKRQG